MNPAATNTNSTPSSGKKAKKADASAAATAPTAAPSAPAAPANANVDAGVSALCATLEGVFNTTQYRLAPKDFVAKESAGVTVRAICLAPLPICSSKACTKEAVDAAANKPSGLKPSRPLNILCMVTEILSSGWSHAPAIGAAPSVVGASHHSNNNAGGGNNNNKGSSSMKGGGGGAVNNERVARFYGGKKDHVLIHIHNTEAKGNTVLRVGKSDDFYNVSVGAILCLPVWATDMLDVFPANPTRDIAALSMLTVELVSKGSRTTNKNAMLTVRRVREAPWLSAASRMVVPFATGNAGFLSVPSTMHEVEEYRRRYATGLHLLGASALAPLALQNDDYREVLKSAGLEGLNQEYIAQSFSKNVALLQIVPKAGQFVIFADGTLRFIMDREVGLGDIPVTDEEGTLRVRVDDRQVPFMPDFASAMAPTSGEEDQPQQQQESPPVAQASGDSQQDQQQPPGAAEDPESEAQLEQLMQARRDWGVAYLNLALRMGIVELLVAVNTQQDQQSPTEAPHYALARFNLTPLLTQLAAIRLPKLPPAIEARFVADRGARAMRDAPIAAFALAAAAGGGNTIVLVVDLRVAVSACDSSPLFARLQALRPGGAAKGRTLSTFMHRDDDWRRANEVFVFVDDELKFHAMAPLSLPGGTATVIGGGGAATTDGVLHRLLPSLPSLPRFLDAVKYEDDRYNNNTNQAPDDAVAPSSSGGDE